MTAAPESQNVVIVRAAPDKPGVRVDIRNVEDADGFVLAPPFDPEIEAANVITALFDLPVETRRAFYRQLTGDCFDSFNDARPPGKAKVHPWPPKSRSHE